MSQEKDNLLEGKSGYYHQKKEKGCRMARRLQTSTGYKCHTLNETKMYFFSVLYTLDFHLRAHL